jgi:uncharacterized membrane protein
MNVRLLDYWDRLRASYWFVPAVMMAFAALAAALVVQLDQALPPRILAGAWFVYESDVEGARTVLLAVAGTAVALLSTVFTLTVVPLTIAAAQLGPRLLRNFLRDIGTQVTLGVFSSTFVYAALVLLELPPVGAAPPQLAVTGAPLLLVVSACVLIYFIHHLAVSVQATNVIREVSDELEATIRRSFPPRTDVADPAAVREVARLRLLIEQEGAEVPAVGTGYVRAIDFESLERVAREAGVTLRLCCAPGAFMVPGEGLVLAWPAGRLDKEAAAAVNAAFLLGEQRTFAQDVEYGINALVEVAIRAMSPAINDPFTCMACVDRLSGALVLLAERCCPPLHRYDEQGRLLLIGDRLTFGRLVDAAFHPIRQYGRGNAEVLVRLLDALALIGSRAEASERLALLRHARQVEQDSRLSLPSPSDQERVRRAYESAMRILKIDD